MYIRHLTFMSVVSCFALAAPAYAISLGDVVGSATSTESSTNPLDKGIDSIAGEGTSNILNGKVSPEVALAGKQLGIPAEYLPQIQELYDSYKGTGSVTTEDVASKEGLSSWLDGTPNLDAGALATGLSTIFAGSN